jgi:hypothetical protein
MIFQHTLDAVLSGRKSQTSRIWKDDYLLQDDTLVSRKSGRRLYYVGQEFSVQPGRGKKAVARRRITQLEKWDVRDFTEADIQREGYSAGEDFLALWRSLHKDNYIALVINFEAI